MRKTDIILACSDLGVTIDGSNLGPRVLIEEIDTSNINNIKTINKKEAYIKDKTKENKLKNINELNTINEKIYHKVKESLNEGNFLITIGGDHSIAIASGLASIDTYKNIGIIWFDAHGDYHKIDTTETGNIHGLPFAVLTGYEKRKLSNFHKGNYYNYKNAVLFGARDIDEPEELNNLKDAGIEVITTEDIKKYGIEKMCQKAFDIASRGTNGIHISYDLDCLDPSVIKGVSVPVEKGLNLEEASYFIDYMIANKNIIKSFDLVEYNPLKDSDNKTKEFSLNILNKIIKNID